MNLGYNKSKLNSYCKENKISYLGLFGSYAKGKNQEDSDVDLLVRYRTAPSLLRHVALERELEQNVFNNRKVDLVTERSINKHIKPFILNDLEALYEEG